MSLTIESIIGLVTVALFWGVTNPFMKKGAKGIDSIKSSSPVDQFFKDVYFLVTTVKYMVPFVVNQIGSLLYVFLLQQTDLSLTVVVVNSLTFLFTAVTGSFLGEAKVHRNTYLGAALILTGTTLCCMDKLKIT
ncbi:transmembrane protein 234 homolog [Trichogramma pretiosum]|uniref:transmembrane protein 234 homolog n=1 Tax=Trichogramma pretiosum TaxID=7493 RepID=UPI0006C9C422|nr:transmembrane protein 234 homolog [Trichogramma pretiosum]